jgi:hypothetical protein
MTNLISPSSAGRRSTAAVQPSIRNREDSKSITRDTRRWRCCRLLSLSPETVLRLSAKAVDRIQSSSTRPTSCPARIRALERDARHESAGVLDRCGIVDASRTGAVGALASASIPCSVLAVALTVFLHYVDRSSLAAFTLRGALASAIAIMAVTCWTMLLPHVRGAHRLPVAVLFVGAFLLASIGGLSPLRADDQRRSRSPMGPNRKPGESDPAVPAAHQSHHHVVQRARLVAVGGCRRKPGRPGASAVRRTPCVMWRATGNVRSRSRENRSSAT